MLKIIIENHSFLMEKVNKNRNVLHSNFIHVGSSMLVVVFRYWMLFDFVTTVLIRIYAYWKFLFCVVIYRILDETLVHLWIEMDLGSAIEGTRLLIGYRLTDSQSEGVPSHHVASGFLSLLVHPSFHRNGPHRRPIGSSQCDSKFLPRKKVDHIDYRSVAK